jgi:dTDP-4-amino-4,6-dideoxygalactose transaminase
MHLQPVFAGCPYYGDGTSERLFENGLCLPSGSILTEMNLSRVAENIRLTVSEMKPDSLAACRKTSLNPPCFNGIE